MRNVDSEMANFKKHFLNMAMVFLICAISGCGETSVPRESDLERYPEFAPFLAGRTGFKGIEHQIDVGVYEFSFPTSLKPSTAYFAAVHDAVIPKGWELVTSETMRRTYRKKSDAYAAANFNERVTLEFDPNKAWVHFKIEPVH